ncbi:2278_t:CDS:1, partial [Gigaspora rosea]
HGSPIVDSKVLVHRFKREFGVEFNTLIHSVWILFRAKVETWYRRGSNSEVWYIWCTFMRSEEINAQ